MRANLYAIRIEEDRVVAASVDAAQAAASLDQGRAVLLATPAELAKLARLRNKALVVIASQAFRGVRNSLAGTARTAGRLVGRNGAARRLAREPRSPADNPIAYPAEVPAA